MIALFTWLSHLTTVSRTLAVFAGVLLFVRLWMGGRKSRLPLPPGPRGYPVFGYLPFLGKDYHLHLTELGRKFGPVYQIFLGGKRVVVISDPVLVRHAFRLPVFSGRPDTELTKLLQGYGIINSAGALWKEQRSFLHSVLRDFGAKNFGPSKSSLERNILRQVSEFLGALSSTNSTPCTVRPLLARAVSNVVGSMLMSVTFEQHDSGFERLLSLIDEGFKLLTLAVPVNFIPLLRYVPSCNYAYQKIKRNKAETAAYFAEVADSHKQSLDSGNVRDFVDAFYLQQKKAEESNKKSYFSEEQLVQVMGDIFSAGLETVTSTLEWAILFVVRHNEVQKRLQEEIDKVIGRDRSPELKDLSSMPYTEATILEVLRRANVIVLGNAHATLEDTELGGYFIPKDSHVLPNLWAIHMDPELWDRPEEFRPERFLVNGRVVKPSFFMPFSVGRRMCVGDNLTRMEVFLFLTSLLQQFELKVPTGAAPPSLEGIAALSMTTQPFQVCTVPRNT
ncbi:cytochrome P450 18a1-like [Uloborus diversus]|uniref:cytochrome P450 18a1-like n=1 Tax=Uloborus diversus TaxID=327109 RepID=UPI00240A8B45|nr:cytochrome P450 18a1-like [Uloborus diversus]